MSRLTAVIIAITILLTSNVISWRSGWSSHADHINAQASKKREKAESTIRPVEEKAATANEAGKVIYKTITRDVVKYVQSPNRIVCRFDDDAVQLRQRAIDAANSIPGFDEPPCKASDAAKDSDEDLQADIESTQCLRQLRLDKYRWQAYYKAIAR